MNNNELIVLGKVKKGASGKPIVVVILFLFIGAIILFLPTIINYFGDYNIIDLVKNGQIIDFFANHDSYINKNNTVTHPNNNEVIEKNYINSKTEIKEKNYTLSNFELTKEQIKFKINVSKPNNFDEQYIYLILKKDNKELTHIKLIGNITNEETITFKFKTKLESLLQIEGIIKNYNDNDYPEFILASDESGLASLTCKLNNDNYEYIFDNNKLIKIKQNLNYNDVGNNEEYLKKFEEYTKISNKINSNNGLSTITENYTGFNFTTDIDLNVYKDLINYNYYSLNTNVNKINFDMLAKGYDCK